MENRSVENHVEKQILRRGGRADQHVGDPLLETKPIEDLLAHLGPDAVFGQAVERDKVTVIPVAEVRSGFGFGGGRGRSARSGNPAEESGGSGGGGGARVLPRGFIYLSDETAYFEPTLDVTRLALAGMALTAWLAFLLRKLLRD